MNNRRLRERTIAFYEVVEVNASGRRRIPHLRWQEMLEQLGKGTLDARSWDGPDRTIFGNIYPLGGLNRLTLHRVRDPSDWLQKINERSGAIQDIEAAADEEIVDTSVVNFGDFGNLVGMIQGGAAAPGHVVLQGWLNHLKPFGAGVELGVVPVMLQAERKRLETATAASSFELRLPARARGELRRRYERGLESGEDLPALGDWLRNAPVDPELTVTIKVSSPRGTKRFAGVRAKLQRQVQELFPTLPDGDDVRAAATLYHGFGDEAGHAQLTELVEHAMTVKRGVPAVNDKGESIRVQAAFDIILGVIAEHEEQLREALGV